MISSWVIKEDKSDNKLASSLNYNARVDFFVSFGHQSKLPGVSLAFPGGNVRVRVCVCVCVCVCVPLHEEGRRLREAG